jgi:hypothetical protein
MAGGLCCAIYQGMYTIILRAVRLAQKDRRLAPRRSRVRVPVGPVLHVIERILSLR